MIKVESYTNEISQNILEKKDFSFSSSRSNNIIDLSQILTRMDNIIDNILKNKQGNGFYMKYLGALADGDEIHLEEGEKILLIEPTRIIETRYRIPPQTEGYGFVRITIKLIYDANPNIEEVVYQQRLDIGQYNHSSQPQIFIQAHYTETIIYPDNHIQLPQGTYIVRFFYDKQENNLEIVNSNFQDKVNKIYGFIYKI